MSDVVLTGSTDGVDWESLRDALVADDFHNGRTIDQYVRSYAGSHAVVFAWDGTDVVGTARVLSDGVCNAYLVDVWTRSSHRRRGVARRMVEQLLGTVAGQHVALLTDDQQGFYERLGFTVEREAMSLVRGRWLVG